RLSTSTPSFFAYPGSSACSASTKAAMPPVFCASAITCSVMVVLPEDSGPKTSTTRPRGKPPTPRAASNEIAPVEITAMGTIASFDPNRMIDPLPNCFSICDTANSIALPRSSAMGVWLLVVAVSASGRIIHMERSEEKANLENIGGKVSEMGERAEKRGAAFDLLASRSSCEICDGIAYFASSTKDGEGHDLQSCRNEAK